MSAYEPSLLRQIITHFGPFDRRSEGDGQVSYKPLPAATQLFAERLFKVLKDDPLTTTGKMSEPLKTAVRSLGFEISERLGPSGMMAVFEHLEPSLNENERSAIDRTWNGIGGWMA